MTNSVEPEPAFAEPELPLGLDPAPPPKGRTSREPKGWQTYAGPQGGHCWVCLNEVADGVRKGVPNHSTHRFRVGNEWVYYCFAHRNEKVQRDKLAALAEEQERSQ